MPSTCSPCATLLLIIKLKGYQAIKEPELRTLGASQPKRGIPGEQLINLGALCQKSEVRDRERLSHAFRGREYPPSRSADDYAFLRERRQYPDREWTLCFWDAASRQAEMVQLRLAIVDYFGKGYTNVDGIQSALASHVRSRCGDSALSGACIATVAESPGSGLSVAPVSPAENESVRHQTFPSPQRPGSSRLRVGAPGFHMPHGRQSGSGAEAEVITSASPVRRVSPQAKPFHPAPVVGSMLRPAAKTFHSSSPSSLSSQNRGDAPVFRPVSRSMATESDLSSEARDSHRPSPPSSAPSNLQAAANVHRPPISTTEDEDQVATAEIRPLSPPASTESKFGSEAGEDPPPSPQVFAIVQRVLTLPNQALEQSPTSNPDPDNNLWPLPALPKAHQRQKHYPVGPWNACCKIAGCGHGRHWRGCMWQ